MKNALRRLALVFTGRSGGEIFVFASFSQNAIVAVFLADPNLSLPGQYPSSLVPCSEALGPAQVHFKQQCTLAFVFCLSFKYRTASSKCALVAFDLAPFFSFFSHSQTGLLLEPS
jgi:hypothetical protein